MGLKLWLEGGRIDLRMGGEVVNDELECMEMEGLDVWWFVFFK